MNLFDFLLRSVWNGARDAVASRRRKPTVSAKATEPHLAVNLGKIVRSPLAPPPAPEDPSDLILTTEEKRRHMYLLGGTGMGKTNLLLNLVRADIAQGRAVCLLDARGELVDRVLMILAAEYSVEQMKERLVLIDLEQDAWSVGLNPLQEKTADVHTRARFIHEVMKKAWEIGAQTDQLLRNSLTVLAADENEKHSLAELEPFLTVPAFRARVLEHVRDPALRRFFARYEDMKNQGVWSEPVLNKVSPWLSRPVLKHMLAQDETLSLQALLDERSDRIILVSLAVNTLFGDAELFGSLFAHMIATAVMRKERRDKRGNEFCLYLDEFEHFDGLDKTFEVMLSEGRKFGLCLCLSHQTTVQLEPKLRSLIRNIVGTQVFFSVGGGDAEALVGEIATDEPKAVLRNLILNQKVGECLVVRKGHPYTRLKCRHVPDPKVSEHAVAALRLAALTRWGKPKATIEADLARREAALLDGANNVLPPASHRLAVLPPSGRKKSASGGPPSMPPAVPAVDPPAPVLQVRDAPENSLPRPRNRRKSHGRPS